MGTEEQLPEVEPDSTRERFLEGGGGTVIEPDRRLMWMKNDTYQMTEKWMSWIQIRDFVAELNSRNFAGYGDWRMPTTPEARSLYDKSQSNTDHWGKEVPVHKIFTPGFGFLCWTSEVRNKVQAIRFGYRRGLTTFDDVYRPSRGASRLVRDIQREDGLL